MMLNNRIEVRRNGEKIGELVYDPETHEVFFEDNSSKKLFFPNKGFMMNLCGMQCKEMRKTNTLIKGEVMSEKILIRLADEEKEYPYILLPDEKKIVPIGFSEWKDRSLGFEQLQIKDCPGIPYVLVGRYIDSDWTWSILGLNEKRYVLEGLVFEPEVVEAGEEYRLNINLMCVHITVSIYDRDWNYISSSWLTDVKKIGSGIWCGVDVFQKKQFLYTDKEHKIQMDPNKDYSELLKEGSYVLNAKENELYYHFCDQPIELPKSKEGWKMRTAQYKDLVVIYDDEYYLVYAREKCLVKKTEIPSGAEIGNLDVDRIRMTSSHIIIYDEKCHMLKKHVI